MSIAAGPDLKEQVRTSVDIVDLVGSYVALRREGRNYAALCPWHNDTKPSLKINPERQSWKCWVCDEGGDIFSFVMKREGVSFREALELLAERAGIEVRRAAKSADEGTAAHKPTLYRAMAWAEQQFHDCLCKNDSAHAAREYLASRGIRAESIKSFRLGYAPGGWQWLMDRAQATPFSQAILEANGLVLHSEQSNRHYDRFRDRIMFSIRDTQQRAIAFGGRVLPGGDDGAKYINSPETRLFSKSDHLYGLDVAREAIMAERHAVIVEGYTDVIMAHQCGVKNVVAVLGTALGPRHIRLLRRYANRVTLVLDGDEAGRRRTNEVLELFVASPLDLRIVDLPAGKDPCDFVQTAGASAFLERVSKASDALTYKIDTTMTQLPTGEPGSVHQNNQVLDEILKTIASAALNDSDLTNPWRLRMEQIIGRLARTFRVDDIHLRERMRQIRKAKRPMESPAEGTPNIATGAKLDPWDRELLWLIFKYPAVAEYATNHIGEADLRSDDAVALWRIVQDVRHRGQAPEFGRLLDEVEDARLKNIMVEVDEAKIQPPNEPQHCLEQLIEAYRSRDSKVVVREKVAELESLALSEDEQLDALAEILDKQRQRQGISAPTDG